MYLKSITVKGFKSFPDRSRLEFGPGVSVIVGPNGSGKSNVTDAVLWALGEQSPGNVRGQSMQDVIFAGAPGRQAAAYAEVELVLDDSEGTLALGAPEVSIYRRLDRTGEGEYRVSGARCRLIDVVELLSDTGLGKEMHSVISQGRVESIVSSKPRDRRMLIEEAAGLGKHRKRRRRAQLKLTRTQENLDRALDVEREARSRLRPLKRQAEAAELHARLERQALEIRWELTRDDVRGHRAALAESERAAAEVRSRRTALDAELEGVGQRREAAEEALAARSAKREELSRRAYAARGAAERISYRADSTRSSAATIEARVSRSVEVEARLREAARDDAPDQQATERVAALEQALAALHRDREAELARELEELELRREQAGETVTRQAELAAEREQQRKAGDLRVQEAQAALRDAERGLEAARVNAARIGGELAAVNHFLRTQLQSPGGAPMLADQLEVEPGYELALAAALDGRLRAAVVEHRGAGAELLDRAGTDGGRALIADPASAAEGEARQAGEQIAPGAEPLLERVRGGAAAVALARALLSDTWVVEDLESLGERFEGVAVTKAGRVWSSRTRELRQAPAVGDDHVLSERNRRERLVRETEAGAQAELDARSALESASAGLAAAQVTRRGTRRSAPRRGRRARRGDRTAAPDHGPDRAPPRRSRRRPERGAALAADRRARGRAPDARPCRTRARRAGGPARAPRSGDRRRPRAAPDRRRAGRGARADSRGDRLPARDLRVRADRRPRGRRARRHNAAGLRASGGGAARQAAG